ncbi:MAG: NADPH-dependent F420 reductase [Nitrososphaerota archaeon]
MGSVEQPIAILGGTAGLGRALAVRLALAGRRVIIGSRSEDRAVKAAEEVNRITSTNLASGGLNESAAAKADLVFYAIPFSGLYQLAKSVKRVMKVGSIAVSCVVPLESELGGGPEYLEPSTGSAAEALQAILGDGVKVVSALTYVSANALEDLNSPVDCDVVVCGEKEASREVMDVLSLIKGVRPLYAGGLKYSRITERLTVLLIRLNRQYSSDRAGIRFTYI